VGSGVFRAPHSGIVVGQCAGELILISGKASVVMTLLASLLRSKVLRVGIALIAIWLVSNRPFWRHVFIALSAMTFAAMLLPDEMIFFIHHPLLMFAIPFTAGFVGVNLRRSGIGNIAAWAVIAILAIALYRAVDADAVVSLWLRSNIGGTVGVPGNHGLNIREPLRRTTSVC